MADTGKIFHPDLDLAEALNIAEAVAAHYDHKSLLGQALLKPILEDLKSRGAERSTDDGAAPLGRARRPQQNE